MNTKTKKIKTGLWFILAIFLMMFSVVPVLWFVLVSFQPKNVAQSGGLTLHFKPTLENYVNVFAKMNYLKYIKNSLIVCVISTLLVILIAALASYALTRKKNSFTENLSWWILSNKMFPPIAIVLPIYLIMAKVHLLDSYISLIIVYTAANIPFAVWMLVSFFDDIPITLDEAAKVDGCSNSQTLTKVVLPLAGSGLLSTGIFIFVQTWSEFLFALLLTGTETKTLPVAIAAFITDRGIEWGSMTAAGTALIIPLAVMFYSIQKYLVRGLSFGAVKG